MRTMNSDLKNLLAVSALHKRVRFVKTYNTSIPKRGESWTEKRPCAVEAADWLSTFPRRKIAIQPRTVGCFVLDVDKVDGIEEFLEEFASELDPQGNALVLGSRPDKKNRRHIWMRARKRDLRFHRIPLPEVGDLLSGQYAVQHRKENLGLLARWLGDRRGRFDPRDVIERCGGQAEAEQWDMRHERGEGWFEVQESIYNQPRKLNGWYSKEGPPKNSGINAWLNKEIWLCARKRDKEQAAIALKAAIGECGYPERPARTTANNVWRKMTGERNAF